MTLSSPTNVAKGPLAGMANSYWRNAHTARHPVQQFASIAQAHLWGIVTSPVASERQRQAAKRAKDRVILKLVGLSAYIYSEEEADNFKDEKPKTANADEAPTPSPGAPEGAPPAVVEFFKRASYEIPGNDLFAIADKLVKASGLAWHPDQLLKLEDDNKDHIAALKNGSDSEWRKVQTALTAARKRLTVLAA